MPLKNREPAARPTVHGAPCSVGEVYRNNLHDAEEIDALDTLLYEEGRDAGYVWQELHSAGYSGVARSTINKHRGGTCRCFTIDKDLFCPECRRDFARCACSDAA